MNCICSKKELYPPTITHRYFMKNENWMKLTSIISPKTLLLTKEVLLLVHIKAERSLIIM